MMDKQRLCPVCLNALRLYSAIYLLRIEVLTPFWRVPASILQFSISLSFFVLVVLEGQNVVIALFSIGQLTEVFVGKKAVKNVGEKRVV